VRLNRSCVLYCRANTITVSRYSATDFLRTASISRNRFFADRTDAITRKSSYRFQWLSPLSTFLAKSRYCQRLEAIPDRSSALRDPSPSADWETKKLSTWPIFICSCRRYSSVNKRRIMPWDTLCSYYENKWHFTWFHSRFAAEDFNGYEMKLIYHVTGAFNYDIRKLVDTLTIVSRIDIYGVTERFNYNIKKLVAEMTSAT